MADNVDFVASVATYKAAADLVTSSGDAGAAVQLVRVVRVIGAEGSRTVRGSVWYDSGNTALTDSAVELTAAVTYIEGGYATNITDGQVTVTLTDSAGTGVVLSQWPLAPRETRAFPFVPGMALTGIKWHASANSAVRAQICGLQ